MKTELIQFHGHDVVTVARDDGKIFVAIRPICDAIGLEWSAQFRRIQRDEVLSSVVAMMATTAADNKTYETLCLPLDMLNGWLFGVDAKRVKPELKKAVIGYQRECYEVLDAHFRGKALEGWPYRAIAKLFDPRMSPGSIANSVQAMVVRGLINPQALATAQHGVSRKAAQRRVPSWGIQQQLCLAL